MINGLLVDLPTVLRAAVPARTVSVLALKKLNYFEGIFQPGDKLVIDVEQAAQWIKSGTVTEVKRWLKK
jgi:hypothetical protein